MHGPARHDEERAGKRESWQQKRHDPRYVDKLSTAVGDHCRALHGNLICQGRSAICLTQITKNGQAPPVFPQGFQVRDYINVNCMLDLVRGLDMGTSRFA